MTKPKLAPPRPQEENFYDFIGRVSLSLIEHNVDAITATMFLREIAEAGGSKMPLAQARHIAQNYVDIGAS